METNPQHPGHDPALDPKKRPDEEPEKKAPGKPDNEAPPTQEEIDRHMVDESDTGPGTIRFNLTTDDDDSGKIRG